ncbi:DUF983 domain-containing protein [Asticcacaulis sp. AC460]|uniref:DUF983 domain-containing protein n=1 Tax=Asticcacaulis sp. AC460 TaxID=1282360 RepID=UPI0004287945|nr:DUF983 domain-containing protein [Asticcacaulis sp. AC460]
MARNGVKLGTALLRGLGRRCPCCGQASAFRGYLKVVDTCPSCDTPLSLYPTDDGPAYLTMLLIGHVIVAPAFFFPIVWTNPQVTIPVLIGSIGALTLVALPFVKGAFLGLLWYLGLKQAR